MQINHPEQYKFTGCRIWIGQGAASIHRTTRIMAQLAAAYQDDPDIRAKAISITQLDRPKDEPAEVRSIFDFVRSSIRYVGDPYDTELVQTPVDTLLLRAGDCDDMVLLLVTLLRTIKYDAFFVVTGYTHPGEFEHVYAGVRLTPGSYLPLDPTERMPMGWEAPYPLAKYIEEVPS